MAATPRLKKNLARMFYIFGAFCLGLSLWLLWPLPSRFSPGWRQPVVRVTDRWGVTLREVPPKGEPRLEPVSLKQADPTLIHWLIESEDRGFYHHRGVSLRALGRAAWVNLKRRAIVQGGSTISMQAARLCLQKSPWRWWQKLREIAWALRLERHLSKPEILTLYLNRLPFAPHAMGVEMASRAYFGHGVQRLSRPQISLLVSLVSAPGKDPLRWPKLAEARRRRWVRGMASQGRLGLSKSETRRLMNTPPAYSPAPPADIAPMFVAQALREAPLGARVIETTLDANLQTLLAAQASVVVDSLAARRRARAALMVVRTRTGEVLAYVGEAAHAPRRETLDLPASRRQPGSTLKPFTYALAFERGFTPASLLADIPTRYPQPLQAGGGWFEPHNYDGLFHGPVLARAALGASLNVAAVDLTRQLGPARLHGFYNQLGLGLKKTPDHYGVGITLGNAEVTLADLTTAYATLGRQGEHKPLKRVRRWRRAAGPWLWLRPPLTRRVIGPTAAFWGADILKDDLAREPAFGRRSVLTFPFNVAAKTGTSSDYRDNWAMGFTPDYTVGVWVGRVSGQSLGGVSGISGAGPLFQRAMRLVQGRTPARWYDPPRPLRRRMVCGLNGLKPGRWCPDVVEEWLPAALPLGPDTWHVPDPQHPAQARVRYPARFLPWAASQGLLAGQGDSVPMAQGAGTQGRAVSDTAGETALSILTPAPGERLLLSAALPQKAQVLTFAASTGGGGPYRWRLNGKALGTSPLPGWPWRLLAGTHLLEVQDATGARAARRFEVLRTEMSAGE